MKKAYQLQEKNMLCERKLLKDLCLDTDTEEFIRIWNMQSFRMVGESIKFKNIYQELEGQNST